MTTLLKAEFRKLLTIRSTYIMTAIGLLLVAFFSFWIEGYKGIGGSSASEGGAGAYTGIIGQSAGVGAVFTMIIAILFTAHEYRYNTIMYTLTADVHRTRVLLKKLLAIGLFSIVLGFLFSVVGLVFYRIGLSLRDVALADQDLLVGSMIGKLSFYFAGYALLATLIAVVTRSVVTSISFVFVFPAMIEPLLGLLLKDNAKYLPFASLDSVMGATPMQNPLSTGHAVGVSAIYLLVGFVVTWLLFTRRDAN
ncbi:MAG TPA: ABC transporter permease subunit [Acinetobacter johnsonii]|jgi:ABC-type transport system involved in multi-copper enzyme maturation permease subunit|nr:ABC transporter permease subunit [Acinetobacter johnsonii]